MVIAAAPDHVLSVLELAGVSDRFAVFGDVAEAVARLRARDDDAGTPVLGASAALAVGLASTALPFAGSREAEAERWLRILAGHGLRRGLRPRARAPRCDRAALGERLGPVSG